MGKKFVSVSVCAMVLGLVACSGITEDGNPNPFSYVDSSSSIGESSSSVVPKSSSSVGPRYEFDLWNGADGSAIVNTGEAGTGYWYSFDDEADGGTSSVKFPIAKVNTHSPEAMQEIVSYCGGLCGTVELGGQEESSAGVGFALTENDSTIDISGWDGLCVSYESELPMNALLGYKEGEVSATAENMPFVNFEKTVKGITAARCAKWGDFKLDSLNVKSGKDVSKKATSIKFKFFGKPNEKGYFNIRGVSSFKHGIVKEGTAGENRCLWNGSPLDSLDSIKMGFEELQGGFWYDLRDNQTTGHSYLIWGSAWPENYMSTSEWMADVVKEWGSLSAKVSLWNDPSIDGAAYAGFGVRLVGRDAGSSDLYPKAVDISDWDGLCVTYAAEWDMHVVLVADSSLQKSIALEKSVTPVEKCFTWYDMSAEDLVKSVRNIEFIVKSDENMEVGLSVIAIGKFSANGACAIDESKYLGFPKGNK